MHDEVLYQTLFSSAVVTILADSRIIFALQNMFVYYNVIMLFEMYGIVCIALLHHGMLDLAVLFRARFVCAMSRKYSWVPTVGSASVFSPYG